MNDFFVIGILAVVALAAIIFVFVRLKQLEVHAVRVKDGWAFIFPSYDDEDEPVRVLRVGGGNQSVTYFDETWFKPFGSYIAKYDRMYDAQIPINDVLMIGGGGYSYPKYALTTNPDLHMDVVEYDPKITEIARKYFYLDKLEWNCEVEGRGRLNVITAEGRAFLDSCTKTYDAVLNDTFSGIHPAEVLATPDATRAIKAHLNENGIYISNVIASIEGAQSEFLRHVVTALEGEFKNVYVLRCQPKPAADMCNNLVIATDGTVEIPNAFRLR